MYDVMHELVTLGDAKGCGQSDAIEHAAGKCHWHGNRTGVTHLQTAITH